MKRVAIFGNAGGGKSALAHELATITGLPLYVIDKIKFRPGGSEVPHEEYLQSFIRCCCVYDEWIIDGFESIKLAWERFEAADTLVHVDLPLAVHALWVTKRLVKGLFVDPPRLAQRKSGDQQLNSKLSGALAMPYRVLHLGTDRTCRKWHNIREFFTFAPGAS